MTTGKNQRALYSCTKLSKNELNKKEKRIEHRPSSKYLNINFSIIYNSQEESK